MGGEVDRVVVRHDRATEVRSLAVDRAGRPAFARALLIWETNCDSMPLSASAGGVATVTGANTSPSTIRSSTGVRALIRVAVADIGYLGGGCGGERRRCLRPPIGYGA
jgi:hypothetical protein